MSLLTSLVGDDVGTSSRYELSAAFTKRNLTPAFTGWSKYAKKAAGVIRGVNTEHRGDTAPRAADTARRITLIDDTNILAGQQAAGNIYSHSL